MHGRVRRGIWLEGGQIAGARELLEEERVRLTRALERIPNAERVLGIVGVVVIVSVIAHGVTATPLTSWYARRAARDRPIRRRLKRAR